MRYDRKTQQKLDEHALRAILRDYRICKERNLVSALPHLEKALEQWLKKVARRSD